MSWKYSYNLKDTVEIDISEDQAEELTQKGYLYNSSANTYDMYEEIYKKIPYISFEYIEEKEVEVPVVEVEVYETKKVKNVSYKEKEKWFFGWFKNIAQKFFPKKESNVSEERIQELEIMVSKWEISDLEIQEKVESVKTVKKVTQKEMLKLSEEKMPFTFLRQTREKKLEKQEIIYSEECSLEDYDNLYSEKKVISEEKYEKKVLEEKIVVDRRRTMTITQVFYIPGVWSKIYNHTDGTKASFNCKVIIKYLSWFNPYDSQYVDIEEIKEDVIKIIEDEHFNAQYIRAREDWLDGFNMEDSKIN